MLAFLFRVSETLVKKISLIAFIFSLFLLSGYGQGKAQELKDPDGEITIKLKGKWVGKCPAKK